MRRRGARGRGGPAAKRPAAHAEDWVNHDPDAQARRRTAKGLGRRSLDALRVGVLVLDEEDNPVLANPAAREMGLLRAGAVAGGSPVAHTVVRTLAGQARRTGTRREVELELPRGNGREPLGVSRSRRPMSPRRTGWPGCGATSWPT
jgi:two-component system sensor histidine kinase SenX3